MRALRIVVLLLFAALLHISRSSWALDYPGPQPGPASASLDAQRLVLQNAAIEARWDLTPGKMQLVEVADRVTGVRLALGSPIFTVRLADGVQLSPASMRVAGKPSLERIPARSGSIRLADRSAAWQAVAQLATADGRTRIRWQAILADGSNYVRQEVALTKHQGSRPVELVLLDAPAAGAAACGIADGSPIVSGNFFLACEHPMAKNRVSGDRAVARLPLFESPASGLPKASAVVGVAPGGQLRRAFLYYLERQRARPYRPFTYYISWFDIAAPDLKMNQSQCVEVIRAFGNELAVKRGVKLDAFVFDDGWDDNRTLWKFHAGFPQGFTPLRAEAARYGAILGTWISPFGGYGRHKKERLDYGRTQGYETNRSGFALSGPRYFERFRTVCEEMIRRYDIGYLKFDGMGGGAWDGPGRDYGGDMQALVHLFRPVAASAPRPVHQRHDRHLAFAPTGCSIATPCSAAAKTSAIAAPEPAASNGSPIATGWATASARAAGRSIRFNSLKFQSVMCAKLSLAKDLGVDMRDLVDDIHMAAASGTQLQEYFVSAEMLSPAAWDVAAEAIAWTQRNADVLVDSHGIGGDPSKGEVYGFASWTPADGDRGPCATPPGQPAQYGLDLQEAFELPAGAARRYVLQTPWKQFSPTSSISATAGRRLSLSLAPWEVLVLEAQAKP